MVWVVLAMALLWAWGVSRDDATYAPPEQQTSPPVSSANLLFMDGPKGRIEVLEAQSQSLLAAYESDIVTYNLVVNEYNRIASTMDRTFIVIGPRRGRGFSSRK